MLFILLSGTTLLTNGQNDEYILFYHLYLDPEPGNRVKVAKGARYHNQRYHKEGESKAYLWDVVTGPRAGTYMWGQGPMRYSKFEEKQSDEHNMDWEQNVSAFCRNISDVRLSRRIEDLTYNPENEIIADNQLARIFYGVTDRQSALQVIGKIKEVMVAKDHDYARRVYTTDFQTKDREDIMLIYPFEKWSDMEKRRGLEFDFADQYDEVHGEGSWEKDIAILSKSVGGFYDEIRTMVK